MSITDEIHQQFLAIKPLYDVCRASQREWDKWQWADLAEKEYDAAREQAESKFDLRAKRAKLANLKQQGIDLQARPADTGKRFVIEQSVIEQMNSAGQLSAREFIPPPIPDKHVPDAKLLGAARRDLKRLVNVGLGQEWKLGVETKSRINHVIDARPYLGEALIMIDLALYEKRASHRETEREHLVRLRQWHEALIEYRERLEDQLDTAKLKHPLFEGILDMWLIRSVDNGWQSALAGLALTAQQAAHKLDGQIAEEQQKIANQRNKPGIDETTG